MPKKGVVERIGRKRISKKKIGGDWSPPPVEWIGSKDRKVKPKVKAKVSLTTRRKKGKQPLPKEK